MALCTQLAKPCLCSDVKGAQNHLQDFLFGVHPPSFLFSSTCPKVLGSDISCRLVMTGAWFVRVVISTYLLGSLFCSHIAFKWFPITGWIEFHTQTQMFKRGATSLPSPTKARLGMKRVANK